MCPNRNDCYFQMIALFFACLCITVSIGKPLFFSVHSDEKCQSIYAYQQIEDLGASCFSLGNQSFAVFSEIGQFSFFDNSSSCNLSFTSFAFDTCVNMNSWSMIVSTTLPAGTYFGQKAYQNGEDCFGPYLFGLLQPINKCLQTPGGGSTKYVYDGFYLTPCLYSDNSCQGLKSCSNVTLGCFNDGNYVAFNYILPYFNKK
jgi:hypothetical protein